MSKKPLVVALLLSLALNVAVVAGYFYQRYARSTPTDLDEVAAVLALSDSERAALRDLRRAVYAEAAALRKKSATPNAQLRRLVATRAAGDPELVAALARITEERALIQRQAIARMIAFRDNLSPPARQRFREQIERPGFMLALFGASSWGLPRAAAEN